MFKKKFKKKEEPLWKSFSYAFEGLRSSLSTERNLLIHFSVMLLVILFGILLELSIPEWMICIILFGLVISAELMNTAIEATVDICSPEIHPKAKLAKDTAAASVLVLAIASSIVGALIFLPKVYSFFKTFF